MVGIEKSQAISLSVHLHSLLTILFPTRNTLVQKLLQCNSAAV